MGNLFFFVISDGVSFVYCLDGVVEKLLLVFFNFIGIILYMWDV